MTVRTNFKDNLLTLGNTSTNREFILKAKNHKPQFATNYKHMDIPQVGSLWVSTKSLVAQMALDTTSSSGDLKNHLFCIIQNDASIQKMKQNMEQANLGLDPKSFTKIVILFFATIPPKKIRHVIKFKNFKAELYPDGKKYITLNKILDEGTTKLLRLSYKISHDFSLKKTADLEFYDDVDEPTILSKEVEKELELQEKCASPNIVRIEEKNGTEYGLIGFKSEWMKRGTLRDLLIKQKFSTSQRLKIACDVAKGLEIIHENGIIFLDLKSRNILIEGKKSPTAKITDFGLATMSKTAQSKVGTPGYMSPEACESSPMTNKTDIFSFGIILFQLIFNKVELPYDNNPEDPKRIQILRGSLTAFENPLNNLVLSMLETDPDKRPTINTVLVQLQSATEKDFAIVKSALDHAQLT